MHSGILRKQKNNDGDDIEEKQDNIDFDQLPLSEQRNFPVLESNKPVITGLEKYQVEESEEPLVLIGTLGLRSIDIACELGIKNKDRCIPKVFIIDFGRQVREFWEALNAFFLENTDPNIFLKKVDSFVARNIYLFSEQRYTSDDIVVIKRRQINCIKKLVEDYGYQFVRNTILQAQFVCQDWLHKPTFKKINAYIKNNGYKNIFVYASNIVPLIPEDNVDGAYQVLESIQSLNPKLAIHLDYVNGAVGNFHLCEDSSPDVVAEKLFTVKTIQYRYSSMLYDLMIIRLDIIIKASSHHLDIHLTPIFPELIFRLAGINEVRIQGGYTQPSRTLSRCIFHLNIDSTMAELVVARLRTRFPEIKASYRVRPNEVDADPQFPARIGIDIEDIQKFIFPLIPAYLLNDSKFRIYHEDMCIFTKTMSALFSKYGMCIGKSDCLEDAICEVVAADQHCLQKSSGLNQTLAPGSQNKAAMAIYLPVSASGAHRVAVYFNNLIPGSAKVEKNNSELKIHIQCAVLMEKSFLYSVENVIRKYSREKREKFWLEAGNIKRTTLDCIMELAKIRETIITNKEWYTFPVAKSLIVKLDKLLIILNTVSPKDKSGNDLNINDYLGFKMSILSDAQTLKNLIPAKVVSALFDTKVGSFTALRDQLKTVLLDVHVIQEVEFLHCPAQNKINTAGVF